MKKTILLSLFITFSVKILAQVPIITDFSPKSGEVGTTVTITGTDFSSTPANNVVYFGATQGAVLSATTSQLIVRLPKGSTYSPISVTVNNLTTYSAVFFMPTVLLGEGILKARSFENSVSLNSVSGSKGLKLLVADFNNDNKPDYANIFTTPVGTFYAVGVSKNNSSAGTFSFSSGTSLAPPPIPAGIAGLQPLDIIAADVNSDGKPDVIISDRLNAVFVYLNSSASGTISFNAGLYFDVGNTPVSLAVGDIDSDGKPDIITANSLGNNITVLRNTSTTNTVSFSKSDFNTETLPSKLVVADMDGDKKADILVIHSNVAKMSVLKNTGSGTISFSKTEVTLSNIAKTLQTGDFDNDGMLDIALLTDKLILLKNTSNNNGISFAQEVGFVSGTNPGFIGIADLDGNSKLDIVVSETGGNVKVFSNQGTQGSISVATFPQNIGYNLIISNFEAVINDLILADMDGDIKPDIFATGYTKPNLGGNIDFSAYSILRNATGLLTPVIRSVSPSSGDADFSVSISGTNFANNTTDNQVFFGSNKVEVLSASENVLDVKVPIGADYQEVSLITKGRIAESIRKFSPTFPSNGTLNSESFGTPATFSVGSATEPSTVLTADLDADGKKDAVISCKNELRIYRNITTTASGDITFGTPLVIANTGTIIDIKLGDLNNDGKSDIILSNGSLLIYTNTSNKGTIGFSTPITYTLPDISAIGITNRSIVKLAIADVDADGFTDIAFTSNYTTPISTQAYEVYILQNKNSGFQIKLENLIYSETKISTSGGGTAGSNIGAFGVEDLNADGKPEIIVGRNSSGGSIGNFIDVQVYLNQSFQGIIEASSFVAKGTQPLSNFSSSVIFGDVDGNGANDMVVINGNTLSVFGFDGNALTGKLTIASGSPSQAFFSNIDGDEKPDLIVANNQNNFVSIYRNQSVTGTFNFSGAINLPVSGNTFGIASTDLNGDTKPDILASNLSAGSLHLIKNMVIPRSPIFTSYSPQTGAGSGKTVTIIGNYFLEITKITFNGLSQPTFTINSVNQLTTTVPEGARSGYLVIENKGGKDSLLFAAIDPANFILGNPVICPDQKTLVYTVPAVSGATAYEWTVPAGLTITGANNTNTLTISPGSTFAKGTLQVRGIDGTFKGEKSPAFEIATVVLPVPAANLQARISSSNSVLLSWEDKSANETEFFIYRARNRDSSFVLLDKRNKDITSYTDNFDIQPNTVYYYRISAVNGECLSAFSNIVGISTPPPVITALADFSEKSIKISPNPSDGIFEITAEKAFTEKVQILVMDALGKIIFQETIKNSSESVKYMLDLRNKASGIYFLSIRTEKSNITKKIIRQ